jgi:hypothetical protein
MSNGLVKSPEKAMWYVEQELYDAANAGGVMAITVHQRKDRAACNTWVKNQGKWQRFLPERIWDGKPEKVLMQGEIMRLVLQMPIELQSELRMKLAIMGLQSAITVLLEK